MGGKRRAVVNTHRNHPANAEAPVPWRSVYDEHGLWSFRLYGEKQAATVLVLLSATGVPARYYTPLPR